MAAFLKYILPTLLLNYCTALMLDINLDSVHAHVEPEFLSVTIDMGILDHTRWRTFNFSSIRTQTLLKGLSPAYLRFGGTSADYTVYSDEPTDTFEKIGIHMLTLQSLDIDNFVKLLRKANLKFILDLNLQLRYGSQWDPSNTAKILSYIKKNRYDDIFNFELGNEPDLFNRDGPLPYNGSRIGQDFQILYNLLKQYNFTNFTFVGPDCAGLHGDIYPGFLKEAGKLLSAVTFHHYYFNGQTAKVDDYIDPVHFDAYYGMIDKLQDMVHKSPVPDVSIWLGEGADSYDSGTPNVTDRFVSGFLWLDKLGVSASRSVRVVMRQSFYGGNYGLTDVNNMPNPDYWLSYIHKQLVGQKVLRLASNTNKDNTPHWKALNKIYNLKSSSIRVFAQCTKTSTKYSAGAVTVFALNVKTKDNETLTFSGTLSNQPVDVYLLTAGPGGLTSKQVALNGKILNLVSDSTLPELIPVQQSSSDGIKLPPLSFGFFVFPNAHAKACS